MKYSFKYFINEVLDSSFKYEEVDKGKYTFQNSLGIKYRTEIDLNRDDKTRCNISFGVIDEFDDIQMEVTPLNNIKETLIVFSTVVQIIKDFLYTHPQIKFFKYDAATSEPSRVKLYDRSISMMERETGFELYQTMIEGGTKSYIFYSNPFKGKDIVEIKSPIDFSRVNINDFLLYPDLANKPTGLPFYIGKTVVSIGTDDIVSIFKSYVKSNVHSIIKEMKFDYKMQHLLGTMFFREIIVQAFLKIDLSNEKSFLRFLQELKEESDRVETIFSDINRFIKYYDLDRSYVNNTLLANNLQLI